MRHHQRLATPICVLEVSSPKISFMLYGYVQDTARKQEPTYTPNGILPDGGLQRCQASQDREKKGKTKKRFIGLWIEKNDIFP